MFRLFFPLIAFLFMSGDARAVTAAWKVPLNTIIKNPEANPAFKKLDKPPGESDFFQQGDELWDMSGVLNWEKAIQSGLNGFDKKVGPFGPINWQGDWIVWNARSELVVASGSWGDLLLAEKVVGYKDLPKILRVRCELAAGERDAMRSEAIVSKNGSVQKISDKMTLKSECIDSGSGTIETSWMVSWRSPADDSLTWSVDSKVVMKDGEPAILARQGEGRDKWKLFGTVGIETSDGVRFSRTRWMESPKGVELWSPFSERVKPVLKPLGEGLQLGLIKVPADAFDDFAGDEEMRLTRVDVPPQAAGWIRGPMVDVKRVLAVSGIKIDKEGFFAGFDRKGCLVVISHPETIGLIDDLMNMSTFDPPSQVWLESNVESGGWGLACLSGERGRILRARAEKEDGLFSFEAVWEGMDSVKLRYTIDVLHDAKVVGGCDSATSLMLGVPSKLGTFGLKDSTSVDLILTAQEQNK